jgi:predicted nucleic-acid-binding Zn-ribbon protein
MPSDDDETEYSVFGNDAANELNRSTAGSRVDPEKADPERAVPEKVDPEDSGLGDGDDGCPKCGGTATETDEIATSGTGFSKLFDVQNRSFVVVSCADCGYSELYKGQSTGDAIDFFIG